MAALVDQGRHAGVVAAAARVLGQPQRAHLPLGGLVREGVDALGVEPGAVEAVLLQTLNLFVDLIKK